MDKLEYIYFDKSDLIEALEDFYAKKTNEKISIEFDDENNFLDRIESIIIKKSISSPVGKIMTKTEDTIKTHQVTRQRYTIKNTLGAGLNIKEPNYNNNESVEMDSSGS